MIEPGYNRVHPNTILLSAVAVIRQMIWVLLVAVIQMVQNRGRGDFTELLFAGMGGIAVVIAVIQYFSYGYVVRNRTLEIRSGILSRNLRTIPIDRVQNVNISRPFLHRLLGLVEVQVETASGAGVEAKISALKEEDAERLKEELTGVAARSEVFARERPDVAYQASFKELMIAGATENRVFTIVGGIFALTQFGGLDDEIIVDFVKKAMDSPELTHLPWHVWALLGLGLLMLGWIVSIVMTLVQYWDFEVIREKGKLKRSFGMFNQIENVLPPGRVQIMRQSQSFVQRWLGYGKLYVETAGSFELKEHAGRSVFTPIALRSEAPRLTHLVMPSLEVNDLPWQPIPQRAVVSRMLFSLLFFPALILTAWFLRGAIPFPNWLTPLGLIGTLAGLFSLIAMETYLAVRKARVAWTGHHLASRVGVFTVVEEYLPLQKVQSVLWSQTPRQRRFRLATLNFVTAAPSPSGKFLTMADLDQAEAERIMEEVHAAVREHADWSSQGF
ncbi:MAG: PH domain-containing protein [Fimbriimonadaceae bacterium]|nr:PH domain-containing protein [Fimbriimonadaceae bacterium]